MRDPNFLLFFVDNPSASQAFYAALLGKDPVESSPNFVLFALDSGMMLGLWSRHTASPAVPHTGGGCELAFVAADEKAVRETYADWGKRGLVMAQAPVALDFGFTFTALDPDGHRLRVFAPGE